jgi:hypothetical protein
MLLLPIEVESPDGTALPPASTAVTWTLGALILALFVLGRLATAGATGHLLGDEAFRVTTYAAAAWSFYPDHALFAPWQLWTWVLVNNAWLPVLVGLVLFVVAGRAVERRIGSGAFAGALALLAPLVAGAVAIAGPLAGPLCGVDGLALGVLGLAWALFPEGRVRFGLVYWVVVAVGYRPLFRLPLRWLAALAILFQMALVLFGWPVMPAEAVIGAFLGGYVIGLIGRYLRPVA